LQIQGVRCERSEAFAQKIFTITWNSRNINKIISNILNCKFKVYDVREVKFTITTYSTVTLI